MPAVEVMPVPAVIVVAALMLVPAVTDVPAAKLVAAAIEPEPETAVPTTVSGELQIVFADVNIVIVLTVAPPHAVSNELTGSV